MHLQLLSGYCCFILGAAGTKDFVFFNSLLKTENITFKSFMIVYRT